MSNNIKIESNLFEKEISPKGEISKNIINSNEIEISGDINNIEPKDIQTNNIEINRDNNNETEKDKINNNIENSQKFGLLSEEKDKNQINIDNLNDKNNINEIKEEKQQTLENNDEKNENNFFEIGQKEKNILIPKIIVEEEEFSPIEKLLQENKNKNNILKNNQIYFTEANTLDSRDYGDIKDIHKSNSNKLYTLTSIPEYSNVKNEKTAETPMKMKPLNQKNKNNNIFLNNLSPEIYMKKKYTNDNKNEINSLKIRIKQIEENIQKQNDYDYKSAMRECKLKFIKDMKNKEKEKQIIEEHKKFEEKLKNMEEYRKNLINNKIKRILKRQKNRNKKADNSIDNSITELGIKEKLEKINNEKIYKTLDSYEEKLPIIPGMPKYEIIKMIKNKEEKDFCINTEQRLKDLEKIHRNNYLKQLYIINDKLAKQNEIYNIRSEKCINASKEKLEELEENYIEKEMLKRYNVKQNIFRELSAKKEKVKENLLKNIESVKEKKELLIKQEQQKIKKILKRLNRQQKTDLKQNLINNENINNHRIYFSNLQKENLNKANKEEKEYYNELILRQEDYFWMVHDLQKDESSSRIVVQKKALEAQNKKENEMKSFNKFKEMMDRNNINNQKAGTKMKLYLEQRRIEIENKKREEEALLENK